jgi:hypothetical protein
VIKKRPLIDLGRLAEESGHELRAMVAELVGKPELPGSVAWSHRFAASGKFKCSKSDPE